MYRTNMLCTTTALLLAGLGCAAADTSPQMKMTTPIPDSITTPESVATRLGTLKFFDGFPDDATSDLVYDNLDFMRGVENAHLDANENAPWAVVLGGRGSDAKLRCPDWDTLTDREAFVDGYLAAASYLFERREDMTVEIGGES